MKKLSRLWTLALFSLIVAAMLAACGDNTATAIPAKTTEAAMAAKTTEAAMMAKSPDAMAKGTDAAMAKPTDAAMAKGTEGAMMAKAGPLVGDFNNQGAEAVSGKVTIGKTTDGKTVLRLENFKSANGPDLHVYLTKDGSPSSDAQIKQGVEVGKLKATEGNLNYDLDSTIDLAQYKSVAIYCKSVSVVFGYANLNTNPA